jgi:hypothetical protein
MKARPGSGQFQWNAGGWFGSQVGATLWLLLVGLRFAGESYLLAALLALCFVVPNVVGTVMWTKRSTLDPYLAIQGLLAVLFVSTAAGMLTINYLEFLGAFHPRNNPRSLYFTLLIFPALMLAFHTKNGAKATDSGGDV